ncbi:hypothetical protein N7G274_004296 [Stereocaulon virgatum]|uniref:Uncharacterized protein n=1 Tax=Stereocaulon virgatum TaxID=373712 RepID=A0ABR4AEH4_9LECA
MTMGTNPIKYAGDQHTQLVLVHTKTALNEVTSYYDRVRFVIIMDGVRTERMQLGSYWYIFSSQGPGRLLTDGDPVESPSEANAYYHITCPTLPEQTKGDYDDVEIGGYVSFLLRPECSSQSLQGHHVSGLQGDFRFSNRMSICD